MASASAAPSSSSSRPTLGSLQFTSTNGNGHAQLPTAMPLPTVTPCLLFREQLPNVMPPLLVGLGHVFISALRVTPLNTAAQGLSTWPPVPASRSRWVLSFEHLRPGGHPSPAWRYSPKFPPQLSFFGQLIPAYFRSNRTGILNPQYTLAKVFYKKTAPPRAVEGLWMVEPHPFFTATL